MASNMEEPSWQNEIQPNLTALSKNITNLPEILIRLQERNTISTNEFEIIQKDGTDMEKNYKLLTTLDRKGWSNVRDSFFKILEKTANQHCISIIMDVSKSNIENDANKILPIKRDSSSIKRKGGRKANNVEAETFSVNTIKDSVTNPQEATPGLHASEIETFRAGRVKISTNLSTAKPRPIHATKVPPPTSNISKPSTANPVELPSLPANINVKRGVKSPNKTNHRNVNREKVLSPPPIATKVKTCLTDSEKLNSPSKLALQTRKNEICQSSSSGITTRAAETKPLKPFTTTKSNLPGTSIGVGNSFLPSRDNAKKELCNITIKASEPDDEGTWQEKFLKQNTGIGIDFKSCDKRLWSACQEKDFGYKQESSHISVKHSEGKIILKNIQDFKLNSLFQSISASVNVTGFTAPHFLHFAAKEIDDIAFQTFVSKCQMLSHLILELPKPTIVSIELSKLIHLKFLSLTNSRLTAKSSDICSLMGTLKLSNCELGANMENEFLKLFPCISRLEIGRMTKLTRNDIEKGNFLGDKSFKSLFQQPCEND